MKHEIKPNVELMRKTLDHITAHPEKWDQGSWVCGTSHCFGGWAAVLAGYKVTRDDDTWAVMIDGESPQFLTSLHFGKVLGLQGIIETSNFFDGDNSLKHLTELVEIYEANKRPLDIFICSDINCEKCDVLRHVDDDEEYE